MFNDEDSMTNIVTKKQSNNPAVHAKNNLSIATDKLPNSSQVNLGMNNGSGTNSGRN